SEVARAREACARRALRLVALAEPTASEALDSDPFRRSVPDLHQHILRSPAISGRGARRRRVSLGAFQDRHTPDIPQMDRRWLAPYLMLSALFAASESFAQASGAEAMPNRGAAAKNATAVRVDNGAVQVDGRLDEAFWSSAP